MSKKKIITMVAAALLLLGLSTVVGIKTYSVFSEREKESSPLIPKCTVILDAGHGGFDPGKIGVNNALEKDINLIITKKLKFLLEANDVQVIMIREEDKGLYQESDSNKKSADLKKRVEIINSSDAVIAVSIHQNSFPEEKYKGAQVFYHNKSPEGKILAEMLQEQIKKTINDGNNRLAKSNESYYMLKKTECPLVIVECGFLSNWSEADLLTTESYQDKMAWSIHLGILSYLNKYVYN
ncbi:N-acetylmuramoyl-L-alanine amidase [Anaerosporobacter faecicola]|uniref:N-acetylmuramoyl-L-alanine amidase n=1 Tax=Anaerosporobacter faecicola TaxID=2718714 RepID=UPI00143BF8FF|nr:N-acetylmuramoyl-L-alanine amidase [Anaerosporobacter faecicola]